MHTDFLSIALNQVVNHLEYPVVILDVNHTIVYIHEMAKQSYKLTEASVGNSLLTYHNLDSQEKIRVATTHLEGGGAALVQEVSRPGPQEYMTPIRDSEGTLLGYFGHCPPSP